MGMQSTMSLERDKAGFLIHIFRLKIYLLKVYNTFYIGSHAFAIIAQKNFIGTRYVDDPLPNIPYLNAYIHCMAILCMYLHFAASL